MNINDRITYINIMGHECPLCLTVRATKVFRNAFGISIKNIDQLLEIADDGENVDVVMENLVRILQILLYGGRDAVQCWYKTAGEKAPQLPDFSTEDLLNIYTMGDIAELTQKIMTAISASYRQEIESKPVKNAGEAVSDSKAST